MLTLYLILMIGGCAVACTLFFVELQKEKSKALSLALDSIVTDSTEEVRKNQSQRDHLLSVKEKTNTSELFELQTKYERLEDLLKEKAGELEKSKIALETEFRRRDEFQKIKDILEKELIDVRNENHRLKQELSIAQVDLGNYQKHLSTLKEELNLRTSQKV